jgi:hypothetical protein
LEFWQRRKHTQTNEGDLIMSTSMEERAWHRVLDGILGSRYRQGGAVRPRVDSCDCEGVPLDIVDQNIKEVVNRSALLTGLHVRD